MQRRSQQQTHKHERQKAYAEVEEFQTHNLEDLHEDVGEYQAVVEDVGGGVEAGARVALAEMGGVGIEVLFAVLEGEEEEDGEDEEGEPDGEGDESGVEEAGCWDGRREGGFRSLGRLLAMVSGWNCRCLCHCK